MTLRQQWTWRENQALARKLEAAKLMLKMTFRTSGDPQQLLAECLNIS